MKVRPIEVVKQLEQVIGKTGAPMRLRDAIEIELQEHWTLPALQAAELTEQLESQVKRLIIDLRVESEKTGSYTILSLSAVSDQFVLGSSYVEAVDAPDVATAKQRRLHIEPLRDHISRLSPREFEVFGSRVLTELGAKDVQVTPHSDDQGIDFYGYLSLGQYSDLPEPFGKLAHDVALKFAGQAKHYPKNRIKPELIRELIGAIELARYRVFTKEPDFFEKKQKLLPFTPLVTLFFTTGSFTRGAKELATNTGIIAKSGNELAVFLADRGVGIERIGGTTQFNEDRFHDWLFASAA